MFSLQSLTNLLGHYGYFVLLPASIIEGPIVTIIAGGITSLGLMSFWVAYAVIIIGDTIGDIIHYSVGRYGGMPLAKKWGAYLGLKDRHIESLETNFRKHEKKSYILGKLAHGVGGAVLVIAGLVKAPFSRFLFWNILSTAVKSYFLLLLGFYFIHALTRINSALDLIASIAIISGVLIFFGLFWKYGK